ncbi:hypothetical protein ACE14D_06415 [Streptomyces sp. Act-28]
MIRRHELSDAEWEFVRPLLPVSSRGRERLDDRTRFTAVMEATRVPRTGPGRPRVRPARVPGDKGHSSKAIRTRLRRGSRGGRPPAFDKQHHKRRNVVERCSDRLQQWRGIATRHDETAESYQAAVTLASLPMWA